MRSRDGESERKCLIRRVPGALWLVFGLLAMNFTIVGTTVTLATSDSHFAVEPDYYQRAVDWDLSQAELGASAALGWRATIDAADARSATGMRTVTVRVVDRRGAPIAGASVDAVVFHHGHAANRLHASLIERGPGVYQGEVGLLDGGVHEVRLAVNRGAERFVASFRQDWAGVR